MKAEFMDIFRTVLNRWAYLDCAPEEAPSDAALQLERSVPLSGRSLKGLLVLRSDLEFGRLLAQSAGGLNGEDEEAQDAFTELCNQYCSHLMTGLWDPAEERFQPFLPKPSQPGQWPSQEPELSCSVAVEGRRVEIRFWSLA